MYGKAFSSMFEGSMYGSGPCVFAVWVYAISHAYDSKVELNEERLAHTLGGTVEEVTAALEFLQRPDLRSRCKDHGGARLVKVGEWEYYLPSWMHYQSLRSKQERREYMRQKMFEYRHRLAEENRTGNPSPVVAVKREKRNGKVKQNGKVPVEIPQTAGEAAYDRAERMVGPVVPPAPVEPGPEAVEPPGEASGELDREAMLESWVNSGCYVEGFSEYFSAAARGATEEQLDAIVRVWRRVSGVEGSV